MVDSSGMKGGGLAESDRSFPGGSSQVRKGVRGWQSREKKILYKHSSTEKNQDNKKAG
jgi:hypothetical protein